MSEADFTETKEWRGFVANQWYWNPARSVRRQFLSLNQRKDGSDIWVVYCDQKRQLRSCQPETWLKWVRH